MLWAGRAFHREAREYWQYVDNQWPDTETEIVYRQLHGSYKAISLARELVTRLCGVLAHYVPHAETEYLPKPNGVFGKFEFIHRQISPEGEYAINLLLGLRLNTSMAGALNAMADLSYFGQTPEDLLWDSVGAMGIARSLSVIVEAHLGLMDIFLNPAVTSFPPGDITRRAKRQIDVFRDFWCLTYLFDSDWRKILSDFHSEEANADGQYPAVTYASFLTHRGQRE